ncbi:unnamed protein product [Meloidogyne enterolobii]|uniref:Uncharacterized protein n=1 Tax=Meloidogyne enterolobii TaxID=390850 RepID=A0ACB1AF51_MELEN
MPQVIFNTTYHQKISSKLALLTTTTVPTLTSSLTSLSTYTSKNLPKNISTNSSLLPIVNNIGGIALFALVLAAFFCFCICVICLGGLCADSSSSAASKQKLCFCCVCECCLEEELEEEDNYNNDESDFSYRRWQRRRLRQQSRSSSNLIYNAATAVNMPSMLLLQLMLADSFNNLNNKNNKKNVASEGGEEGRVSLYDRIRTEAIRPTTINRHAERSYREACKELVSSSPQGAETSELLELLNNVHLKAILQAQEVSMEEIYAAITPIATTSSGSSQPTSPDVVVINSPQLIAGVNVCRGRKYFKKVSGKYKIY